jgi:hypothetical protein
VIKEISCVLLCSLSTTYNLSKIQFSCMCEQIQDSFEAMVKQTLNKELFTLKTNAFNTIILTSVYLFSLVNNLGEIVVIIMFRQYEPALMLWEHAGVCGSSCC